LKSTETHCRAAGLSVCVVEFQQFRLVEEH